MRVAVSIAEHEIQMAHRWMDWVCELGGAEGHSLYLIPADSVNISDILPKAERAFDGRVNVIKDDEGQTSNWQITEPMRSASGPNSAFRQVAWHFYLNKLGPWFWCELDCIPTRKDWLDKLEAEYKVGLSKGKPFTGARVLLESVPEHLTGNSVYPWNVPEEAPTIVMRTNWTPRDQERSFELAFDIAGAQEVIPKSHFTNLIQHKFRYEGFKSRTQFDAVIDKSAVVFHSCKDGSIYQYLRQNLSGGLSEPKRVQPKGDLHINKNADTWNGSDDSGGTSALSAEGKDGDTLRPARETASVGNKLPAPPAQTTVESKTFKPELESVIAQNDIMGELREGVIKEKSMTDALHAPTQVQSRTITADDELQSVIAQNAVIRKGLPAMSPPWENKEDSERDVKMLCDALSLFCKAPLYKSRVRNALREAKIIK
jgi:hypothetical protein